MSFEAVTAILPALTALVALVIVPATFCAHDDVPVRFPRNPSEADTVPKSRVPLLLLIVLANGLYSNCESTKIGLCPSVLSTKARYLVALVVVSLSISTKEADFAVSANDEVSA